MATEAEAGLSRKLPAFARQFVRPEVSEERFSSNGVINLSPARHAGFWLAVRAACSVFVAMDPSGKFLYTGAVAHGSWGTRGVHNRREYRRAYCHSWIVFPYRIAGGTAAMAIDPRGEFLYVADDFAVVPSQAGDVAALAINATIGALTAAGRTTAASVPRISVSLME